MRFPFLFVLFLLPASLFSVELDELRNREITFEELKLVIEQNVLHDDLDELDRWKRVHPDSFTNVNIGEAYYEVGLDYYDGGSYYLALSAFLGGFNVFESHDYKDDCAYYIAKIFYNQYERDNALFYINRCMEMIDEEDDLYTKAKSMKRRIRWSYISIWEGLPDNSISDIEFDGDDIWLGLWSAGAGRYTTSSEIITLFDASGTDLISDYIRDICVVGNIVWVGTYDGLCFYDKRDSTWSRAESPLKYAIVKRVKLIDLRVYISVLYKGLYIQDIGDDGYTLFFNKSKNVTDVYEIEDKIYIGTLDDGVYILDPDGSVTAHLLEGEAVKAMAEIEDELWVGIYGGGVARIDPETESIASTITEEDGLSSDFVESFAIVRNRILIGTLGGGVTIYNQVSDEFSYLGILDGLPSMDVVTIEVEDEQIWFGTLSGGIGILLTENFRDL